MGERKFVSPDPEWWAWHPDGYECAPEGSVRDARKVTRGKAAAFYAREIGEPLTRVRVWKRYARPLSHEDAWEDYGRDRWCSTHNAKWEDAPESPPDGWEPDDYDPVWTFVHRSHPEAIPVWICGERDHDPPQSPARAVSTTEETGR